MYIINTPADLLGILRDPCLPNPKLGSQKVQGFEQILPSFQGIQNISAVLQPQKFRKPAIRDVCHGNFTGGLQEIVPVGLKQLDVKIQLGQALLAAKIHGKILWDPVYLSGDKGDGLTVAAEPPCPGFDKIQPAEGGEYLLPLPLRSQCGVGACQDLHMEAV